MIRNFILTAIFAILFFAGCATNFATTQSGLPDNSGRTIFYGLYRNDLRFRAIAVNETDGYRVVITNDLGAKLQDMKVSKSSGADYYFIASLMPKNTIEEFEVFFQEYFCADSKNDIKNVNGRTYYYDNAGNAVLWIKEI
ncbi:hypothetical protein [Endomicrobium proavitum]|nr:hypothetical protein [Endomicrobium proavitum]